MESTDLTVKQAMVLGKIKNFIDYKGYAPTTEEIAAFVGSTYANTGLCHIKALRKKGAVRFDEKRRGSLRIVKGYKAIVKGEAQS